MTYLHVFLNSIKLPKKKAMFQLNRVGMDTAVIYMFILLGLVSIPALIEQLTATSGLGADMNVIFKFVYFFMFYYLPLTILVFIAICFVAYIGRGLTYIMQRKLRFSILWKMCAFTTTIPFLLYIIISFIIPVRDSYLLLTFIFSIGLLFKMISIYPKRRK
ncbi:DUF1189 family protein [Oceanobacillus polygoni]|uniref:ABC-type multidrug transport system permease subunit n=1 Tax=Oceanobacillus polygoni TaxID=1235259 RepID=A0A9X0YV59_9BACI|nr:DUF1189 family protein [Oceanobacillus polygoni]MBP2078621.1 ABC-type multidrug transport system permease subunit [Oceanobacillus polygoni]